MSSAPTESYETAYSYGDVYYDDPEPCQKAEVRKFGSWFLPTFYSLVILFGFMGNALVLLVLVKYKKLRSMTDVYLLNLAISDMFFVFALPFWAYFTADEWVFGDGACKIISWVYQIGFFSGIFFIVLMSIDRYLAVVHVVFAMKARTTSYGRLFSCVAWAMAAMASIPELIFSKAYTYYNHTVCKPMYLENETAWKVFASLEINVFGLLVPFVIMSFCYAKIVKNLLHCRNAKKEKAVKMIFAVMIVFFVFWTPYNIVLFLQCLVDIGVINECSTSNNLDYAGQVTQTLAFFHCCLNPVIYFFMGQKFKKYIKLFFKNSIFSKMYCQLCGLPDVFPPESSSSVYTQSTSDEEAL